MPLDAYLDFETSRSTKSTMPEDTALLLEYNKGDVVNLKTKEKGQLPKKYERLW